VSLGPEAAVDASRKVIHSILTLFHFVSLSENTSQMSSLRE
jgi:hypothetical protein